MFQLRTPCSANRADLNAENNCYENLPNKGRMPNSRYDMAFLHQIDTPTLQNRSSNNWWGEYQKFLAKALDEQPGQLKIRRVLNDANNMYG